MKTAAEIISMLDLPPWAEDRQSFSALEGFSLGYSGSADREGTLNQSDQVTHLSQWALLEQLLGEFGLVATKKSPVCSNHMGDTFSEADG
ncbi:MAG TPA: hypothetical protein VG796_08755 [Verrucomicrobiales bacterium]|jgi:hypothetical protein|nr:hypothetical protein [Verrucomicrobiales bacterium]